MNTCRFFVSYRREDKKYAERIYTLLRDAGHQVLWDEEIESGSNFWEEIQKAIQRVHIFIPVMTSDSWESVGVQQEIGYAIACNVPVVPVSFGIVPEKLGMIRQVQEIVVPEQISQKEMMKIVNRDWANLLQQAHDRLTAVFRCDGDHKIKSKLITTNAQEIIKRFKSAKIMQRSTLTSFSLPLVLNHKYWREIHDRRHFFWLVPEERELLQKLADGIGYDLIIDPCYSQSGYRLDVLKAKLNTLREFLQENVNNPILRVVADRFERSESEIIIGDYWMAHSAAVATMATERETISTCHAPTIWRYHKIFQKEFQTMFDQHKKFRKNKKSAQHAIDMIDCRLKKLTDYSTVPEKRCENCQFEAV